MCVCNSSSEKKCDDDDEITVFLPLEMEAKKKKHGVFVFVHPKLTRKVWRPLQAYGKLHMEIMLNLVIINWLLRRIPPSGASNTLWKRPFKSLNQINQSYQWTKHRENSALNRAGGFSIMLGSIVVCFGGGSIDHDPTTILKAVAD